RMEVHHILARLAVDPVDRWLDRELAQMIAEMLGSGVEPDDRQVAADGQQHDARPVAAESRVELERPRHDLGTEEGPRTVADDDDFLGVTAGGDVDKMAREPVDALIP